MQATSIIRIISWVIVFVYVVFPSTLLLIFREPEVTATVNEDIRISALMLISCIVVAYTHGVRGLVPSTAIALGLLKYKMDACLWKPPEDTDLSGKYIVVTGGNSGLGFATAKSLVRYGAHVIITCRSVSRCENAAKRIASEGRQSGGTVESEILDLSSLKSTYDLTVRLSKNYPQIHYLISNAGSTPRHELTEDGLEDAWGSMHLSHMALTLGLLPSLRRAGEASKTPARIVMVGSEAGVTTASLYMVRGTPAFHPSFMEDDGEGDLRGEIIRGDGSVFGSFRAYSRAKLCNTLFAIELNRRLKAMKYPVIAHALHTGGVGTKSSIDALKGVFGAIPGGQYIVSRYLIPLLWRSPEEGARILLYAAIGTEPASMVEGGQYINGIGRPVLNNTTSERMKALRLADDTWSERLWEVSVRLLEESPFREIPLVNI